jgi:hypothetical protein
MFIVFVQIYFTSGYVKKLLLTLWLTVRPYFSILSGFQFAIDIATLELTHVGKG